MGQRGLDWLAQIILYRSMIWQERTSNVSDRQSAPVSQRAGNHDHVAVVAACTDLLLAFKVLEPSEAEPSHPPHISAEAVAAVAAKSTWLPKLCKQVIGAHAVSDPLLLFCQRRPLAGMQVGTSACHMCHAHMRTIHPIVYCTWLAPCHIGPKPWHASKCIIQPSSSCCAKFSVCIFYSFWKPSRCPRAIHQASCLPLEQVFAPWGSAAAWVTS